MVNIRLFADKDKGLCVTTQVLRIGQSVACFCKECLDFHGNGVFIGKYSAILWNPSSSEFAIRWCQVLGFAIPFYDGGSHGNKFFFSGKYSGFFGKARKKRVFSALQMLL